MDFKTEYGRSPSARDYFSYAKINYRTLIKAFGSGAFAKLVLECGNDPNKFSTEKVPKEQILEQWGTILRKEGKQPTHADWLFYKCTPEPRRILLNHGIKWASLPKHLLEYAQDKPGWADVLSLVDLKEPEEPNLEPDSYVIESDAPDFMSYVPPIVQHLEAQSFDESRSLEFEKKVNVAFQLLGFEIENMGQGTGRNPDGIAKDRENHYAILIDAKARKEKYSLGTEDRKFIEYIKKFVPSLKKDGYESFYFLVVSSEFSSISTVAMNNIFRETNVKISFISAKNLVRLVADKIQNPRKSDLGKLRELFLNGGHIDDRTIKKYVEIQLTKFST